MADKEKTVKFLASDVKRVEYTIVFELETVGGEVFDVIDPGEMYEIREKIQEVGRVISEDAVFFVNPKK